MLEVSYLKPSEICRIRGIASSVISKKFKGSSEDDVLRANNRIIGIKPKAVQAYLSELGHDYLFKGGIFAVMNCCGGTSKTSSTINLASAYSRISNEPVVIVDADSQSSTSKTVAGSPKEPSEKVLVDYFKQSATIDEITEEIGENRFIIRSNMNNILLDKQMGNAKEVKEKGRRFIEDLFAKFGSKAKIFIDFPPQLSNTFVSVVLGLNEAHLEKDIYRKILVPLRSDSFSLEGGKTLITEALEALDTFNLENNIDIVSYFSQLDRRFRETELVVKEAGSDDVLKEYMTTRYVRYASEVIKCNHKNENVFTSGKSSNVANDYVDLLLYILDYHEKSELN